MAVEDRAAAALTVRQAAFIGVGAMVGAGIFALLGAAGEVAGAAVWISFLFAGGIAGLQGYSLARFGARYPSSGGMLEYVIRAFGNGHFTGVIAWLLFATNAIITGILAVFAVTTLANIDADLLAFSGYPSLGDIVSSVALTFFAFLGFGVITFTARDLADPARQLPRAVYLALALTTLADEPGTALALVVILAMSIGLDIAWKQRRQTASQRPVSRLPRSAT